MEPTFGDVIVEDQYRRGRVGDGSINRSDCDTSWSKEAFVLKQERVTGEGENEVDEKEGGREGPEGTRRREGKTERWWGVTITCTRVPISSSTVSLPHLVLVPS